MELKKFFLYVHKGEKYIYTGEYWEQSGKVVHILYPADVQRGENPLNQTLYACSDIEFAERWNKCKGRTVLPEKLYPLKYVDAAFVAAQGIVFEFAYYYNLPLTIDIVSRLGRGGNSGWCWRVWHDKDIFRPGDGILYKFRKGNRQELRETLKKLFPAE